MVEILAAAFVFMAVVALVYGIATRNSGATVIDRRFARLVQQGNEASQTGEGQDMLRNTVSTVGPLRQLLSGREFADETSRALQRAGLNLRVGEYILMRLLAAMVLGGVSVLLLRNSSVWFIVGPIAAVVGFMLPAFYVRMKTASRQRLMTHQLAEALRLIANALRSGVAFLQAVKMAVSQMPPPVSDEFEQFLNETSLGSPADTALRAMAERSGSVDMDLVVTTILVQRTAGGRLSEVLDRISETMEERERLQGEIRAKTAQQRLTGNIMTFYPAILGFIIFLISPETTSLLWTDEFGRILLGSAIVLQLVGMFWMRRILSLEP